MPVTRKKKSALQASIKLIPEEKRIKKIGVGQLRSGALSKTKTYHPRKDKDDVTACRSF